ncbi:hypothetical protein MM326_13625 [Alkalihalobacillus sp. LMS6]|jgi:hypothetical protein|uniref:hypothetical protein n=1 Tax=Alkalihalobacillus sp. LMS6 TaxID=2924034 RepID=UPI0020D08AFB|nr:hypothetical protein [Alkalihalobacillus sp. LMS6]UTR05147.1 hypothetical protein MM326_13625 [Alkalihalobacillus sp. LMS6]
MAVTLQGAEDYINAYIIDNEDWAEADETKKQRIVNVAERTLRTEFAQKEYRTREGIWRKYIIPDEAVYEFAAGLSVVFNDTNRLQQHGIAGFSVTGVASFTFKENNVKTPGGAAMKSFIGQEVYDLINESPENADLPKLGGKQVKWTVL